MQSHKGPHTDALENGGLDDQSIRQLWLALRSLDKYGSLLHRKGWFTDFSALSFFLLCYLAQYTGLSYHLKSRAQLHSKSLSPMTVHPFLCWNNKRAMVFFFTTFYIFYLKVSGCNMLCPAFGARYWSQFIFALDGEWRVCLSKMYNLS